MSDGSYLLKTAEMDQAKQDAVMADLESRFGEFEIVESGLVGPSVGAELKKERADFSGAGCGADDCLYHLPV